VYSFGMAKALFRRAKLANQAMRNMTKCPDAAEDSQMISVPAPDVTKAKNDRRAYGDRLAQKPQKVGPGSYG